MKRFLVCLVLLGLDAVSAHASAIVFDLSAQTAIAGDTLVFTGILSNGGLTTVYLNSAQLNLAGNAFTADFINPFNNNVPFWLDPGQSTSSIELFDVIVNNPFTDPLGAYDGTYKLLGGIDSDAQDVFGSADFSVTVNAAFAVPEPSLMGALVGGLVGLMALRRRKLGRNRQVVRR